MGTHMTVKLRNTSEKNIKSCNKQIRKMGFKSEVFEGIPYGPFVTNEQLEEDARFMSEDPEGLRQCPGTKRPITPETIEGMAFWLKRGQFYLKLSGGTANEELEQALFVAKWAELNPDKINTEESNNFTVEKVSSYLE